MIKYSVSDGVCVLRLSAPPVNAITFALLEELQAAVRRANSDTDVCGIVITGDADHFSAGADVGIFKEITSAADAVHTSRVFQGAFQEVEDSHKPVVAAVAGRVMGSALELAMACHFRVSANTARFSMPEVNLGINPGAGGTQRLPRLVGPEAALKILLKAETIDARNARALGLIDAVCDGHKLVDTARGLLQSGTLPRNTSRYTEKVQDAVANAAALDNAQQLLANVRPEIIAPRKIIEAVKAGLEESFRAGSRKEQEAFAACMDTPATQNKIYLFFAVRQTSKVPELAGVRPADVTRAAVVGMGTMGTGIAQSLIMGGIPVVVHDKDDSALHTGTERIAGSIRKRVKQGRLSQQQAEDVLGLISTTTDWQQLADADLIVESVFEDVAVKQSVIGRIEDVCAPHAIIASNTSTISLDVLAHRMQHPQRLIGLHFFNPAHRMPLLEIIRREATPRDVLATALKVAKTIRKTPVVVGNREGFLVNRLFIPYLKEAFWLLEDGVDARAVDSAIVEFGFPMGPLTLIDMAGLEILADTDKILSRAFPRHGPLSEIALRLVEKGDLGQKTGSGVYKYEKGDYAPHDSPVAQQIIAEVRQKRGRPAGEMPPPEITRRLVLRMVTEAFYEMEEGIIQRESDLDAAVVLGTGFPDFRGGPLKYARDLGLDRVLAELQELAAGAGERFAPCTLLQHAAAAEA